MVRNEIYVEKFFLIWKNCDKNFLGFLFCLFAFLFHFSSLAMIFWVLLISLKGLHYCYSYFWELSLWFSVSKLNFRS